MTEQVAMTDEQFNALEAQFPDVALVKRYLEIRRFLEEEATAQAAHVKPHVDNMDAIANELHRRLLKRNPTWQPGMKANGSTPDGTFFLKTNNSVKVADREAFFAFLAAPPALGPVLEGNSLVASVCTAILDRLRRFATAHVAKDGVEGYLDELQTYRREHGGALPAGVTSELPPGIFIDRITKLEVRKT